MVVGNVKLNSFTLYVDSSFYNDKRIYFIAGLAIGILFSSIFYWATIGYWSSRAVSLNKSQPSPSPLVSKSVPSYIEKLLLESQNKIDLLSREVQDVKSERDALLLVVQHDQKT